MGKRGGGGGGEYNDTAIQRVGRAGARAAVVRFVGDNNNIIIAAAAAARGGR